MHVGFIHAYGFGVMNSTYYFRFVLSYSHSSSSIATATLTLPATGSNEHAAAGIYRCQAYLSGMWYSFNSYAQLEILTGMNDMFMALKLIHPLTTCLLLF